MNNNLNVLYQFNEKYAPFAAVSIASLLENNMDIDKISIYVLEENVSECSKKQLEEMVKKYRREIVFIETEQLVNKMKNIGIPAYRDSYATNFKMFLSDILPPDLERILYIDSDTIIEGSLKHLITIDMNGCPIGMVLDSLGKNHAKAIGMKAGDNYVNGGVILYDIVRWKQGKWTEKIVDYTQNIQAHFISPDQDIINIVLKGKIFILPPEYNLQPIHQVYSPKQHRRFFAQQNYYNFEMICSAVEKPIIIHTFRFLGEFPWHKNSLHPDTKRFDFYLKKAGWNNYKKEITNMNSFVFKVERFLYKVIPKYLFLILFKINYEYFIFKAIQDSKHKQNNKNM